LRAQAFAIEDYISEPHYDINVIAVAAQQSRRPQDQPPDLWNPYEGNQLARQLDETVSQFLNRLPPSKTEPLGTEQSIWIANPYATRQETNVDRDGFLDAVDSIIEEFELDLKKETSKDKARGVGKVTSERALNMKRRIAEGKIHDAAKTTNMLGGKWMLRPSSKDVDRVWGIIAQGTASGELGSAAQVALKREGTANGKKFADDDRLVCVYTKDFSDEKDVGRVLDALGRKRLVPKPGGIYYKSGKFW
jgi:hypothetical protein